MRLVHEQPVHAQLLEGHHIVLAALGLQFFQPGLQGFAGAFQLLDGKPFAAAGLHLGNALGNLVDLLMEEPFLALHADGDLLKLRIPHDNGVVAAGGDAGAELFPVVLLKILFCCDQDIGRRVQPQKLRSPLLGQVVGNDKEALLAQAQPFGLHRGGHHLKGLARAHLMGQQGVAAVEDVGNGSQLVLPQLNGGIHAAEGDVAAVILAGAGAVHFLVILADQRLAALRVFPNPVPESVPDGLLLLGGQGGFFGVQHPAFPALRVLDGVVDSHVPQVQGILQNLVGVGASSPVGGVSRHVPLSHSVFTGNLPLGGEGGVVDLNVALEVKRGVKGFVHKLLDVLLADPGRAQAHLNLRSVQVFGLGGGQGLHVDCKGWVLLRRPLGLPQLPAHVAGKVFVGGHIMGRPVLFQLARYTEDDASQLGGQFLAGFACQLLHIRHIHAGFYGLLCLLLAATGIQVCLYLKKRQNKPEKGLYIDLKQQILLIDGMQCAISSLDLQLLYLLWEKKGECVNREDLKTACWPHDPQADEKLDAHIQTIRKVLQDFPDYRISTARGRGYYLTTASS